MRSLINELSSKMKANKAIIKPTRDSIQIHINIVIKNKQNFQIQNRGNAHKTKNITIQEPIATVIIFNKFLKNH